MLKKHGLPKRKHWGRPPLSKLSIADAMTAVQQIEQTITQAFSGVAPDPTYWGPIDANAFINIVCDVTSFLLTNFGDRRLTSLVSLDLQRFTAPTVIRCFASHPRYAPHQRMPIGSLVTLANIVDPAARRAALFWARELMHARSMRTWIRNVNHVSRVRRQIAILQHQNHAGLAWLIEQASNWPTDYRKQWWANFANIMASLTATM